MALTKAKLIELFDAGEFDDYINGESAWSGRNLLHNWDFRNPVNQRGVSGNITTNAYFYDRWFLATYPSMLITVNANYLTLSGGCELAQFIEGLRLKGKVVTASIKVNGSETVLYGTGTFPATDTGSATITIAGFGTIVINNFTDRHAISIRPTSTVNVECVKLELGTVSTLAYDPPADYGAELLKCQRYYKAFVVGAAYVVFLVGYAYDANQSFYPLPLQVPMRIPPSIVVYGTFSSTLSIVTATTSFVRIMGTQGGTPGTFSYLYSTSANAQMVLSADL